MSYDYSNRSATNNDAEYSFDKLHRLLPPNAYYYLTSSAPKNVTSGEAAYKRARENCIDLFREQRLKLGIKILEKHVKTESDKLKYQLSSLHIDCNYFDSLGQAIIKCAPKTGKTPEENMYELAFTLMRESRSADVTQSAAETDVDPDGYDYDDYEESPYKLLNKMIPLELSNYGMIRYYASMFAYLFAYAGTPLFKYYESKNSLMLSPGFFRYVADRFDDYRASHDIDTETDLVKHLCNLPTTYEPLVALPWFKDTFDKIAEKEVDGTTAAEDVADSSNRLYREFHDLADVFCKLDR